MAERAAALRTRHASVVPLIEAASKLERRLDAMRSIEERLRLLDVQRNDWDAKRERAAKAAEHARTEYARILAEAGRCPTCGGPVDHELVKEVF